MDISLAFAGNHFRRGKTVSAGDGTFRHGRLLGCPQLMCQVGSGGGGFERQRWFALRSGGHRANGAFTQRVWIVNSRFLGLDLIGVNSKCRSRGYQICRMTVIARSRMQFGETGPPRAGPVGYKELLFRPFRLDSAESNPGR